MEAAANHLATKGSVREARAAVKETATEHLHALDRTMADRAAQLGKAGKVSKAHQAVKDELKSRGAKALSAFASKLPFGPGHPLWTYWTVGKGAAKWMGSVNPWTTLHALLLKYVGPRAAGLTTNVMRSTPAGRALFDKHHGKGKEK